MKIKRTVAALLCAALTLSACGALVACGGDDDKSRARGTASLDLSDYAAVSTVAKPNAAKTKLELISPANTKLQDSNNDYLIFVDDSTPAKYTVYFMRTGNTIGCEELPVIESYGIGNFTVIRLSRTSVATHDTENAFYAPDGTLIFDFAKYHSDDPYYDRYLTVTSSNRYEGNNRKPTRIISVSATLADAENATVKYYKADTETHDYTSYIAVDGNTLKDSPSQSTSDYSVGAVSGLSLINYTLGDLEWQGALADYRTKSVGDTKYFYKNNGVTGTVDLSEGEELGYVGNYFYYYTISTVAPESSSYNVAVQMQGALVKGNYKLFKYDVVNNSTSELATDVMITDLSPIYNYRTKAYDAAYVGGVEKTDGIFYMAQFNVEGMPDTSDDVSIFLVDSGLNTAAEVPDFLQRSDYTSIYKVDDGKFRVGNYIVDNGFNYICAASGTVYEGEKLISFSVNGKLGLKDWNDRIVVAPKYESIGAFFGGVALATKYDNNTGDRTNLLLDKMGGERELPKNDINAGVHVVFASEENGTYYIARRSGSTYNVTVYNYAGTELKTFSGLDDLNGFYLGSKFVTYDRSESVEIYKIA